MSAGLNLDTIRIFCDVARQRSFSRGAEASHVSQSAASQAVNQIEKRLGVLLIDRSKRPLELTPAGQRYLEVGSNILNQYTALEYELSDNTTAPLRVASIYSVGLYDMNQYVQQFEAQHPQGEVRLEYVHPDVVYRRLQDGEADLGLISFPRSQRELEVIPWREEPMVLVCTPEHWLADRNPVDKRALNQEKFVTFDADLAIRRQLDQALRDHHIRINVVQEFDNIEAIKRSIEAGSGISILPEPTIRREVDNGALVGIPIEEFPFCRPLCIIHRHGRSCTPAMQAFIALLTGKTPDVQHSNRKPRQKTQRAAPAPAS